MLMQSDEASSKNRSNPFGIAAVVLGALALMVILCGPALHDALDPPPTSAEVIAGLVVDVKDAIRSRVSDATSAAPASSAARRFEQLPYTGSRGLAGVAIIAAGIAYARRENRRLAIVGAALGGITLLWNMWLLSVAVLILLAIVYLVLAGSG